MKLNLSKYLLLGGLILPVSSFATSFETNICLTNQSNQYITTQVTEVRNSDWDGDSRPDHNLNNITIAPHQAYCAREEVNLFAVYGVGFSLQSTTSTISDRLVMLFSSSGSPAGWAVFGNEYQVFGDQNHRPHYANSIVTPGYNCPAVRCAAFDLLPAVNLKT